MMGHLLKDHSLVLRSVVVELLEHLEGLELITLFPVMLGVLQSLGKVDLQGTVVLFLG